MEDVACAINARTAMAALARINLSFMCLIWLVLRRLKVNPMW